MAQEIYFAQSSTDKILWISGIRSSSLLQALKSEYESILDNAVVYRGGSKTSRYDTMMTLLSPYLSKLPITYFAVDGELDSTVNSLVEQVLKNFVPILYRINIGTYSSKQDVNFQYSFFGKDTTAGFSIKSDTSSSVLYYIGISSAQLKYSDEQSLLLSYATSGTYNSSTQDRVTIYIPIWDDSGNEANRIMLRASSENSGSVYINLDFKKNWSTNWEDSFFAIIGEGALPSDPYYSGGTSGTGGGTGSFDGTGDAISAPSVPTLGATTTGFVSLYNPTLSQVQELASYMWSDAFSIDSFKKLFADPMDTILGLSIVPVAVPDGETTTLKVGNLSTGISITRAGAQYITVDCGSIAVDEYWGAYLDYAPYTKLEIYLPYIGTHQLSADDVMGKTISVKYNVDILSGSCVAFVTCGDSVLYTFSGQCSQNIPITGEDFTSNLMGAISFAASAGAVVASGGGAAAVMPAAAGLTSSYINAFKPDIQRSGNIGGTSGMLGIQVPYLILTRPRQCTPENQNKYLGYPSFITEELSELSGYTEIEDIQLEGCTATDTEIDEIKSLLAGGVLL